MSRLRVLALAGVAGSLACAQGLLSEYPAAGGATLCAGAEPLGVVAVLPETAWRADQKEPAKRQEMAARAIAAAFADLPCGDLAPPGGVRAFGPWSATSEGRLLTGLRAEGVDTAVWVRIEELTPTLAITFSVPFLWGSTSEADFRVRALRTGGGAVLMDRRIRRRSGGAFQLRPASWAEPELEAGLRHALTGE